MKQDDIKLRNDRIFDIVVKSYIKTAEPVGSQAISKHSGISLSPASIRNIMMELEELGLLKQPHTSAGRVPTDRGYRYWVDSLMEPEELAPNEKKMIYTELVKARTIEALAERVSKVIAELTENAALIYIKSLKRVSFLTHLLEELVEAERLVDFLEEESELFIEGTSRMFGQPEFQDLAKMRLLLQAFDEKDNFEQIFQRDLQEEGIHVHIGSENEYDDLENVSLVVKDCYLGGAPIGVIAVAGPTRMKYPKVVSVVNFVADSVTETMKRF